MFFFVTYFAISGRKERSSRPSCERKEQTTVTELWVGANAPYPKVINYTECVWRQAGGAGLLAKQPGVVLHTLTSATTMQPVEPHTSQSYLNRWFRGLPLPESFPHSEELPSRPEDFWCPLEESLSLAPPDSLPTPPPESLPKPLSASKRKLSMTDLFCDKSPKRQ